MVCAMGTQAGQVTLSWDPNTESALGGYRLYYGTSSGSYTNNVDVGKVTTYTLNNLPDGATYYFAAQAYDTTKTTTSGYSNEVSLVAAPVAKLTASPASGSAKAGQTVTFTDASQGSVTSRSWNLGNGVTSTATSASTNYSAAGTYTVTLKVTGPGGSNTSTQSYVVQAAQVGAPVANFTASTTTGAAPLPVAFTDTSTGNPTSWSWSFGDGATATTASPSHTYATPGTYTVSLTVNNAGGSSSKSATVTVSTATSGGGNANGLVAAYAFEEMTGANALDVSGLNNHGVITAATRTNNGKFGRALSFNGTNAWVTAKDAASLDLSAAMTMEAWVYPQTAMSNWASVVAKETTAGSAYSLVANAGTNQPTAGVLTSTWWQLPGGNSLPATTWKHLAATYDGASLKLFVDAVQVAQGAVSGKIQVSDGVLRIGGHSVLGDFFAGRIDEVRLYNRALSQAEIAADRTKPIVNTLWKANTQPANAADTNDKSPVELGVKFKSDVAGSIMGIRFYKGATNTGTHVGTLWSTGGQQLARATFSGETASGWQEVRFQAPVKIDANTVYVASYHTNVGQYAYNQGYFASAARDNAPLHALGGSGNTNNGVYAYSANPAFPRSSYQSTNYWVDVIFKP